MAYNYEYPYTNPTQPNLDWLINTIKDLAAKVDALDERVTALENAQQNKQ